MAGMLCSLPTLQFSNEPGTTSEKPRYFPKKYSYEAYVSLQELEVVHVSTTELAYEVEQHSS